MMTNKLRRLRLAEDAEWRAEQSGDRRERERARERRQAAYEAVVGRAALDRLDRSIESCVAAGDGE